VLSLDASLLCAARIVRLFAYGFVAVVLVLYLASIGLDGRRIGLLLSLTLAGDVVVSLYLTTRADALGRRRTLLAGAVLMIGARLCSLSRATSRCWCSPRRLASSVRAVTKSVRFSPSSR